METELPDNFEELRDWIKSKEEENNQFAEKIPELSTILDQQRKAEQELMAKVQEIANKRREIERQQALIRSQVRANQTDLVKAKRRLETFASQRAIEERLRQESEEFDRITAHYQWREFAFSHQIDGARRLATARRGILGDKRGLGKSLTSLIWADMLQAKKVLIFAPKDVLNNFKREIEHWVPHRNVAILSGMPKMQRETFLTLLAYQEQFTILCNYEAWRRDEGLLEYIKNLRADTVIIDEAHNIKEKRTSAYRGIRDIVYAQNQCNVCKGIPERVKNSVTGTYATRCATCLHEPTDFDDFCSVKNVLPMTGTAILNKPQDLWTLLNLVDRTLFPSENAFLQDYCTTDLYTGRWTFKYGGEEALIKKLGPRFVKRDKNSPGIDKRLFKKQVFVPHVIEFDKGLYPDQWKVMRQIIKFGAIKMAEGVKLDVVGILPELLRRRQAITWPAGIKIWEYDEQGRKTGRVLYEAPATESIKMDKALEIAQEIIHEEHDRLVIFSQFKEALKELERRFNELGISVVRYDGDISDHKANEAQLDFDAKTAPNHPLGSECNNECVNNPNSEKYTGFVGQCPGYKWQVIVAHYKKGGVGLNLNAARQMIILDREWNPGKEDQAVGRIDRLGNAKDSVVHTIHVEGTIDAFMDQLIDEKKKMIDGFETTHEVLEKLISALKDGDML